MAKQKPELHLMKGDAAQDVDQLAKFFEKLTGRKPTPEELEEAREMVRKDDLEKKRR